MNPAYESAVTMRVSPGVRRFAHRPKAAAVLVGVLVASLAALLPNAAQAHDFDEDRSYLGGAMLKVTPDGYNEGFHLWGRFYTVQGKDFTGLNLAYIYQCKAGETGNLNFECQLLGTAPTDLNGNFEMEVYMRQSFSSTSAPPSVQAGTEVGGVHCFSHYGVQCSIVAATFGPDPLNLNPNVTAVTSKAEHLICFEGNSEAAAPWHNKCAPTAHD